MTLFPSANNTQAHAHEDPDTNMDSDAYFKQMQKTKNNSHKNLSEKEKKTYARFDAAVILATQNLEGAAISPVNTCCSVLQCVAVS